MSTKKRTAAEGRSLRVCDVCGQVDDHPRHVFYAGTGIPVVTEHIRSVLAMTDLSDEDKVRIVEEIADTSVQQRHIDCCAEAGCPDAEADLETACHRVLEEGGAGKKGAVLAKFLTSGGVDHLNAQEG